MSRTATLAFFALFLPIITGIACAFYERLVVKSGFTIGQYALVANTMYCLPILVWCFARGELRASAIVAPLMANWLNLLIYTGLCLLLTWAWYYCTNKFNVVISSSLEATYPLFVMIFAVIINKRPATFREAAAVGLIVAGILVLVTAKQPGTIK